VHLEGGAKTLSGSELRARIAAGEGWEPLVPPAVARRIRVLQTI
jgi:hypothetical protein